MKTYSFVIEGKRITTVNTQIILRCVCGKRTTADVEGPQEQKCEHCDRKIWKMRE